MTGLCYVGVTRTLWACCACGRPYVYDLHSGSNITEIVHTGVDGLKTPSMLKLWYFETTKDVIATTAVSTAACAQLLSPCRALLTPVVGAVLCGSGGR